MSTIFFPDGAVKFVKTLLCIEQLRTLYDFVMHKMSNRNFLLCQKLVILRSLNSLIYRIPQDFSFRY
jgi:hypothetical protein